MDGPVSRDAWLEHPHFPRQTLLLRSHESFRRISRMLIERAQRGDPRSWIAQVYRQWIAAMRSHEAYEEHKLYPYLARRWGLSFDVATAGHKELHARDRDVREALPERDADDDGASLLAALVAHDAVLDAHLRHEEELVIPALLELRPDEFDEYCALGLTELLRRLEAVDGR